MYVPLRGCYIRGVRFFADERKMVFIGARRRAKQNAAFLDGFDGTKNRVVE